MPNSRHIHLAAVATAGLLVGAFAACQLENRCARLLTGTVRCEDRLTSAHGTSYEWTVDQPGAFEVRVTPHGNPRFPLDAQVTVVDQADQVLADEVAMAAGRDAHATITVARGTYRLSVADSARMLVRGGFTFALEIRPTAAIGKP